MDHSKEMVRLAYEALSDKKEKISVSLIFHRYLCLQITSLSQTVPVKIR